MKKLAKIPPGGGWRVHGRFKERHGGRHKVGYAYIHSVIDAYSRLAYSEIHDDERAATAIDFWRRARTFYAAHGITIERVMTDNGSCYVSKDFEAELAQAAIAHTRISPTDRGRTARSSATTALSSTNGPMPAPSL